MDLHIGTAITGTVTANPGMAASSGPSRFRSGVRTGAYLSEDAQLKSISTFEMDEHLHRQRRSWLCISEARTSRVKDLSPPNLSPSSCEMHGGEEREKNCRTVRFLPGFNKFDRQL
jgi:hypothetical protein